MAAKIVAWDYEADFHLLRAVLRIQTKWNIDAERIVKKLASEKAASERVKQLTPPDIQQRLDNAKLDNIDFKCMNAASHEDYASIFRAIILVYKPAGSTRNVLKAKAIAAFLSTDPSVPDRIKGVNGKQVSNTVGHIRHHGFHGGIWRGMQA